MIEAHRAPRASRRRGADAFSRASGPLGSLGVAVLLAACAAGHAGSRRAELSALVGRPEAESVRRLGPPVHVWELQGVRTLT